MHELSSHVRFVVAISIAMILLLHHSTHADEPLERYHVLCVGVNKYAAANLNPLKGCVNDAKAMASLFGGSEATPPLLDDAATKASILTGLSQLGQNAPGGSNVLVYISGHGARHNESWYFCPHDFDASNSNATGLQGWEILAATKPLRDKHCQLLIVLDSCHSAEFVKSCESELRVLQRPEMGGMTVFTSCAPTQSSWDGPDHSLFTKQLMHALSPLADLDHGDLLTPNSLPIQITLGEVRRSLSRLVRQATFDLAKLPGMERSEQEFLVDWSLSVSDKQVILQYARPLIPYRTFEQNWVPTDIATINSNPAIFPQVVQTPESLIGTWVWATPMTVLEDGKIEQPADEQGRRLNILILRFDGQGNYVATQKIGFDAPIATAGRYEFEPGSYFRLAYGTGSDSLGLRSLTKDELVITYELYQNIKRRTGFAWDTGSVETFLFKRVVE